MAHDVFVSYSAKDKPVADAVCATLESRKIRCWIAPRDVLPGADYATALINGINDSRLMIVVFSNESNKSTHVMREVERAVSKAIPIIPLRIENVTPSKAMEYYLSTPHWLDAITPPLETHLQKLADTVQTLLGVEKEKPPTPLESEEPKTEKEPTPTITPNPKPKKIKIRYVIAALALIAVVIIAAVFLTGGFPGANKAGINPTATPVSSASPTATPTTTLSSQAITPANAAQVKQIGQLSSDWVHQIAWSPDGKFFAAASVGIDIYDAQTTQKVYTISTVVWPTGIAFSPDSKLLVAGGDSGLFAWNVDGWGQALSNPNVGEIACIAFSSDGKTVAAGVGSAVTLIDITSGNVLRTMPAGSSVMSVAFSFDGKTLASGEVMGDIKLWDPQSGQELKTLTGQTGWIDGLAFSPNGQILASGSTDKTIMLWNPTSGQQIRVITGHTDEVTSVAFSPNGQLLASASWDLTVRLWNVQNGQQLNSLTGHTDWVNTAAFSPDGATLASGAEDQAIRLWGLG
ncbi:MAG: TIR domain-containing protein [Candidatus Bathyarchaeia archaeon]